MLSSTCHLKAALLLKHYRPETSIKRDDLHGFKQLPSADLIGSVQENMPEAEMNIQSYARSLAGAALLR